MIAHLSVGVADLDRAAAFYDAVLAVLGYQPLWRNGGGAGYGPPGGFDAFALFRTAAPQPPPAGFHFALTAPSREAVDRFHALALELGAQDDGLPGLRPRYGEAYYAAYVVAPEGCRLEAVHGQPGMRA